MTTEKMVREMVEGAGGKVDEIGRLPDGSGFATASFPLPKDHWLYAEGFNVPPMPFRMGTGDPRFHDFHDKARAAARYAIRSATMNGKDADFDPDAMVQNFLVGLFGYHTPNALSGDTWANPDPVPPPFPGTPT